MTSDRFYYFFSYFAVCFALAVLLVPLMRPLSFRIGAIDIGTGRRVHDGVIPRLGGVGIYLAFSVPFIFFLTRGEWDDFHAKMVGVLIASGIVFITGVYDDIKGVRVRNKLFFEILAATIIYIWGIKIDMISNPFGGRIALGWMSLPVTVLWIIIVTNAFNLIDGLDGLAAGTGIFIAATFFYLVSGNDVHLQLTYVILMGSLLGFLGYNLPPASIFMGDSGSLFLGFFLSVTALIWEHKATAFATMMVPIIAFSFPLTDMLCAVLRRYHRGLPLGEADKEHIHHKLLEKGLSKRKTLLTIYGLNICMLLLVLFLVKRQYNVDFIGLVLVIGVAILGLRMVGYIKYIPLAKELIENYDLGRRRKYFIHVIKQFRASGSKSDSLDDLREHLNVLGKEYNFSSIEICLNIPSIENPIYQFGNKSVRGRAMTLSFPIITSNKNYLGEVRITQQMRDGHFLCSDELVRVLSSVISDFVMNHLETTSSKV